MKIGFCTVSANPQATLMLNTITVRRKDGKEVILDRDETDADMENGVVIFRGTYVWDSRTSRMHYCSAADIPLYDGAEIVSVEMEDDVPDGYDVDVPIGQSISAW